MAMESSACNIPPPADLLHYLPIYRVVVCSLCQYAVQPTAISGHLKDIHNLYRAQRRPYMQYVSQLQLNKLQEVIDSTIVAFPVPFLQVQDGLQCLSEGCGHLCVSENRMKSHWIARHGRPHNSDMDWRDVPLQTFFRGNLLRYFTGTPRNKSAIFTSVLPALKEKIVLPSVDIQPLGLENPFSHTPTEASLRTHYITSTCLTLSTPSTTTLWRDTVPSIARTQPFLHYGLLALSALHLSHTTSNHSHALVAAHYQSIAMPLFRHAVAHVNKQNCDAVLIFMHFLVMYTFASERDKALLFLASDLNSSEGEVESGKVGGGDELEGKDGDSSLPLWLYFLRSGCVLLFSVWDAIEFGLVYEMAASWDTPIPISALESPHTLSLISYFDTLVPSPTTTTTDSASKYDNNALWDEDIVILYKEAASSLAAALTIALLSPSPSPPTQSNPQLFTPWLALRIWPMKLTPSFLSLLSTHRHPHPAALILLAHYCLVLRHLDGCWYFCGGVKKLLGSVLQRLGEEWRGCVEWPVREIFGHAEEGGGGNCNGDALRENIWPGTEYRPFDKYPRPG